MRDAVFVIEQKIPVELEWDQWDGDAVHALARDAAGEAIGTGRLLPVNFDPGAPELGHIGRMAVCAEARRTGVGGQLLLCLMQEARTRGFRAIALNAQSSVRAFYASHGFTSSGTEFLEVGIPHVHMRAPL